jgi:transposase InsO family protein
VRGTLIFKPLTLGKIERFWKSILGEFLQRAQFDSFEQAVERTAFWVKYYNSQAPSPGHRRPCARPIGFSKLPTT